MAIATPLSTSGRFIVDKNGARVRLAGVNWYGASEDTGVPGGLDRIDRGTLAGLIAAQGFNSVRLPFSVWMTRQTAPVPQSALTANPDLFGKNPLEVFDACVKALTDKGLIVIPNCHLLDFGWCCKEDDTNGLWFNDRFTAQNFTDTWTAMATRYKSNPLVAAMDIKNEPRPAVVGGKTLKPAWGKSSPTDIDIAPMYTTVGNAILHVDPQVLIICEGLGFAADLTGVHTHPIKLSQPNKVVYSMHDYHWFHTDATQKPAAYAAAMNQKGGFLLTGNIAPLWIGEFGRICADSATEGAKPWWGNITAWLAQFDVDWCWWALNPIHGQASPPPSGSLSHAAGESEPFGLLTQDWSGLGFPGIVTSLKQIMHPQSGPHVVAHHP
jgi:endoglucanase